MHQSNIHMTSWCKAFADEGALHTRSYFLQTGEQQRDLPILQFHCNYIKDHIAHIPAAHLAASGRGSGTSWGSGT